ncbi:lipoate--protein ligase family protein [Natrialbaceae archaeon GCM10025810]|uniref:lipoyl protein ligase domain-containing protein n=1 Tax=Halovalidus salilacus TaxID=3075124 RepID=UPI00361AE01E
MRVFRGRAETVDADRAVTERLLESAADGERAVRVWHPHRQVAFGRRDASLEGYERAREAAREAGFPPVERSVGGRAVAYDGETTIAFARAEPVADFRRGTDERYERLTADVERALRGLGADPATDGRPIRLERGEPPDSFCPGTHSLSTVDPDGRRRKVAGVAQRVRSDAALVSGVLVVDNRRELAAALEAVYGALEVPLDPETVGSVADGDGVADGSSRASDPAAIREALENALVGPDVDPESVTVEPVH